MYQFGDFLEFLFQVYKEHLEAFLKVANASANSGTTTYGGHIASSTASKLNSWTSFDLKELTVSPIYAFVHLPACRAATLEYFANLIREHLALYLSGLESPGIGKLFLDSRLDGFLDASQILAIDYGNVEEALNEIDGAMQQDLRERDGQFCLQIFEVSLTFCLILAYRLHLLLVFSGHWKLWRRLVRRTRIDALSQRQQDQAAASAKFYKSTRLAARQDYFWIC